MSSYEIIYVTSSSLSEEEQGKLLKKAESTLKKGKAAVEQQFVWGRRRLAYPIDNQDYGVTTSGMSTVPAPLSPSWSVSST